METAYAERYRELYTRHWWWRARERLIVSTLRSLEPAAGWRSILDVGCGDGLFFDRLAELGDVQGVEADASLVDPRGKWASRIRIAPFDETFRTAERFALITMLDVLEHLPDARAALRHAATLLEPDGTLVVTVPAFPALWTSHDALNHHVQRFTIRTLGAVAHDAGIAPVSMRYFYFWTCPVKLLIRLKERTLGSAPAPPRVPAAPINRALYAASVIEQATLGRLPMPFGSSLLMVARRSPARPGA